LENYIEINLELTIYFEDWVYDGILNRTLQVLENEHMTDFVEFITEGKREEKGCLILTYLDFQAYKTLSRSIVQAYNNSRNRKTGVYNRKTHNLFLKSFNELTLALYKDERIFEFG
jgi:hypothetical protein